MASRGQYRAGIRTKDVIEITIEVEDSQLPQALVGLAQCKGIFDLPPVQLPRVESANELLGRLLIEAHGLPAVTSQVVDGYIENKKKKGG